jgi:hypothetical protein
MTRTNSRLGLILSTLTSAQISLVRLALLRLGTHFGH